MALPLNRSTNEVVIRSKLADLSTAGSAFGVAVKKGWITRVYSIIANAITVADSAWTVEINGTAITGAGATVAYSGSAGGDVDSYECSNITDGTNYVNEGDTIEFISDGGSTTACVTHFYAVIRGD